MDHVNTFDSRATHRLLRGEYAVALLVCLGLFLAHADQVRWLPAVLLFGYIDLVGYLPGALAWRRAGGRPIGRGYYVAYNLMHSALTQAVVAAVWIWWFGAEWALLALPIHLCGDRALFGNFLKPFGVPFEPAPVPAFEEFRRAYGST